MYYICSFSKYLTCIISTYLVSLKKKSTYLVATQKKYYTTNSTIKALPLKWLNYLQCNSKVEYDYMSNHVVLWIKQMVEV
jgi:hypothetical protein